MESGRENPYLHAYFAGVGYAKAKKKQRFGFKNAEQRERFEAGVAEHKRHFVVYNARKSFLRRVKKFFAVKKRK